MQENELIGGFVEWRGSRDEGFDGFKNVVRVEKRGGKCDEFVGERGKVGRQTDEG